MTPVLLHQETVRDDRMWSAAPYERQARGAGAMRAGGSGEELVVGALAGRVLRLQQEISALAGDAADTERQLALVCRRLARQNPERSTVYLAAADEADRFAAHKREEQHRWQLT